ncbi:tyrosine-type recombinase/integrase [Nocardioides kongjuensis]|uniref:Integrase/recombinase XerD n=1 Tax=Nocardioides kongjuensis TaxID=349522 RepID=A0A852S4Z5_9ACTN|nr:integrase/recombinase XerD [Nocardioides kongjuensis]
MSALVLLQQPHANKHEGVLTMTTDRRISLDEYADWMRAHDASSSTIAQRVKFARGRCTAWGSLGQPAHVVAEWLDQFDGRTRNTYRAHLINLYAWLVEAGHVDDDPTKLLQRVPNPRPRPRPLTSEEIDTVLDRATGHLRAWILLAYLAGLRAHEIAKFRGEDIDRDRVTVLGKGRQLAVLPTHDDLWELAGDFPRRGFWFPSERRSSGHIAAATVSGGTKRLFQDLGMPGAIHRVRATYGTSLLRSGANVRVVQDLMRHRSLASTEHYLLATEDELSAAIKTLGRRAA